MDSPGGDETDSVFQMRLCADVREKVSQAAFSEQINVQFQGTAEPRNAEDLAARPCSFDGLSQRLCSGQSLFRTATRSLEDDFGPLPASQIANRSHDVTSASIQRVVRAKFLRHAAGLFAHVHGNDHARHADARNL